MPCVPLKKNTPSTASNVSNNSQARKPVPYVPTPSRAPPPPRTAPTTAGPAWRSKTVANKSVAPNALMRQTVKTQASRIDPTMASAMRQLNINNGGPPQPPSPPKDCFDPSMAPAPPDETAWQGSATPTIDSKLSTYEIAVFNKVCRRTTRTIADFKAGQIISVPYHVPNLNPSLKANHPRLALTCEGPVFSKRRILCVLYKFHQDLLCLSMFTFEGKGFGGKPEELRKEFVAVVNKGAEKFHNPGIYQPIEVETYDPARPMKETSCIKLTGPVTVNVSEHVGFVGRMDQLSWARLAALFEQRQKLARQKGFNFVGGKAKAMA
ncbi:hypothetical protein PRZ48_001851 [Zasmidium cellare]|uniref:DUF6590 domain-containing protein n=1 Tax=Zasmidium cellare TaxID=395010 RepID=A0ABR0F3Q8_ZASCE|nr:hypothetical protein PRZ48_001851 [Zasmidium cellare]